MPYRPLWESLASEARGGKGLVLAIDAALRALWDAISSITSNSMVWSDADEQTTSAGVVTRTAEYNNLVIDTEFALMTDDVDQIVGFSENEMFIVRAKDPSRTVILKDGTWLKLRGDFELNGPNDNMVLVGSALGICYELSRSSPNTGEDYVYEDDDMKFGAAYDVTISAGVVTGLTTRRNLRVDTEGSIASDDLTSILGYVEGDAIIVSAAHTDRSVVMVDGGNFNLQGVNFTMDSTEDSIFLVCLGGNAWKELSRSAN